jgi:Antimicrobial peptide resistance and lipid A acylation protein PagP
MPVAVWQPGAITYSGGKDQAMEIRRGVAKSSASGLACLLALVGIFTFNAAHADEWNLLVNGKTIHLGVPSSSNLNEDNWGLGLQYDWNRAGSNWVPFATASGFKDSNRNASYYAGGGVVYRFKFEDVHADVGLVGFVMTRKGYRDGDPFLGALPAFSVGTRHVALNFTYIPKIEPKSVPLWFFQLKINLTNLF